MELADQCIEEEIMAHNLLWLRKQYGYSQKEMARLLGIGVHGWTKKSPVSAWETGDLQVNSGEPH